MSDPTIDTAETKESMNQEDMNQEDMSREDYRELFERKLEQIDAKIEDWRKQMAEASEDVRKINFVDMIDNLEKQRANILQKLEELGEEEDESLWESMRQGFENAWRDMVSAIDNATDSFRQN